MWQFMREFGAFLMARRKLWLVPLILVMVILGGIFVAVQGSAVAPFIYTMF